MIRPNYLNLTWWPPTIAAALLVACPACAAGDPDVQPVHAPAGYGLVWHDEFNQTGPPDPNNWTYEQGYVRNKELQWYQAENVRCDGQHLVIEARREHKANPEHNPASEDWGRHRAAFSYTSASVTTQDLHRWRYGRFEVRAKAPIDAGMWPAIWMMGVSRNEGRGWPGCGEIDLMEYYQGMILANAAWAGGDGKAEWDASKTPVTDLTDETPEQWASRFHVWRMDWDHDQIMFYIDDRLLNTIDLSVTINQSDDGMNPFHEPHYLLLNLAVGGVAGGDPTGTVFPQQYLIDYVRIFKKQTD